MNQNLTFNLFPEQRIEWKVACLWNDEKKNVDICPTIVYKYAWNLYHELVKLRSAIWSFFFGPNPTLFLCKNQLLWVKVFSEKEAMDYRKGTDTNCCGNCAGRSEDNYTRKEVKLKPFLCQRLCRTNSNSTFSEYHFEIRKTNAELKIERLKFPVSY